MGELNKVWDETEAWKNMSQYLGWVRGQLRKSWSDYPVRKNFKSETLLLISQAQKDSGDFHPSTKKVGMCVMCEEFMAGSKLEVDHITPSDGCKTKEEAESFLWYCMNPLKGDMQLVCKPCHKVKTYSERMNTSFDEAVLAKKAIAFSKLPINKQKEYLLLHSVEEKSMMNAKARKGAYLVVLKKGVCDEL